MEKQITIPLLVPSVFEDFLFNELPRLCPDLPSHYLSNAFLIPVHDATKYTPAAARNPLLASLPEESSEKGNLRYWAITNESMWTRQHHAMDEVFCILWSLFRWFQHEDTPNSCNVPEATWHLARSLRRRALLPKVASALVPKHNDHQRSISRNTKRKTKSNNDADLDPREALLFREWVLTIPHTTGRMDGDPPEFEEDGYLYPVPDELFWSEGDEGKWDAEEVPEWISVGEDDEETATRGTCTKRKRVQSSSEEDAKAVRKEDVDINGEEDDNINENEDVNVDGSEDVTVDGDEDVDVNGNGELDSNRTGDVEVGGEEGVEANES